MVFREPRNVITVGPETFVGGQKGSKRWVVRTQFGGIKSHHNTKKAALKAARRMAKSGVDKIQVFTSDNRFDREINP